MSKRTTPRKGKPVARTPERAVILLRASVDAEDRTTLITQKDECENYAAHRKLSVVATFTEDGTSGYKPGTPRPGFDAAMKMIRTGQADVLIVWKLDRLIRNLMGFVDTWGEIQDAGGEFASVVEQFDTSTTMGRLMLIIVAAFAEMESEMKRDRALPFHKHRKEQGLVPGGPRPYGYVRGTYDDEGNVLPAPNVLTVVDDEAAVITEMAELVLAGKSLQYVQSLMAEVATGSKGVPLTLRGIKRMLISPTTAGLRSGAGDDERLYEGNWSGILSRDQHEQLVTMLNDPARRTNFTDGKPARLLSGIIRCAAEGCEMAGAMRTKNHPAGKRYLCKQCGSGIKAQVADDAVERFLLKSIDPDAWQRLKDQGQGFNPDVIAALEAELDVIDDMRASGELSPERYRRQNAAIMERISAATNSEPLDLPDIADLQSGWKGLELEDQRSVVLTLLESVKVTAWDGVNIQAPHERIIIQRAM